MLFYTNGSMLGKRLVPISHIEVVYFQIGSDAQQFDEVFLNILTWNIKWWKTWRDSATNALELPQFCKTHTKHCSYQGNLLGWINFTLFEALKRSYPCTRFNVFLWK